MFSRSHQMKITPKLFLFSLKYFTFLIQRFHELPKISVCQKALMTLKEDIVISQYFWSFMKVLSTSLPLQILHRIV